MSESDTYVSSGNHQHQHQQIKNPTLDPQSIDEQQQELLLDADVDLYIQSLNVDAETATEKTTTTRIEVYDTHSTRQPRRKFVDYQDLQQYVLKTVSRQDPIETLSEAEPDFYELVELVADEVDNEGYAKL